MGKSRYQYKTYVRPTLVTKLYPLTPQKVGVKMCTILTHSRINVGPRQQQGRKRKTGMVTTVRNVVHLAPSARHHNLAGRVGGWW